VCQLNGFGECRDLPPVPIALRYRIIASLRQAAEQSRLLARLCDRQRLAEHDGHVAHLDAINPGGNVNRAKPDIAAAALVLDTEQP